MIDLSTLTDVELAAMTSRAWREAARCWSEYRAWTGDDPVKVVLLTSAQEAEAFWATLSDERKRRGGESVTDAAFR